MLVLFFSKINISFKGAEAERTSAGVLVYLVQSYSRRKCVRLASILETVDGLPAAASEVKESSHSVKNQGMRATPTSISAQDSWAPDFNLLVF